MIEPAELARLLPDFLPRQRWYGARERRIQTVEVPEQRVLRGDLGDWPVLVWAIAEVTFDDGESRRFQVPVGIRPLEDTQRFLEGKGRQLLGDMDTDHGPVLVYDALVDPELCLILLHEAAPGEEASRVYPLALEQSNTSIVFDERLIMKLFRRLHLGPNPDVEIPEGLRPAGFEHVPPTIGAWRWGGYDLAVVRTFLTVGTDGWLLALTSLRDVYDRRQHPGRVGGDFAPESVRLGIITASMHVALANAFGAEPARPVDWAAAMQSQLETVSTDRIDTDRVRAVYDRLASIDPADAGSSIRVHGDYHLGQIMRADEGWVILDFEGEPVLSLEARRARSSPLRDVAGMLRSFHYAAQIALLERGDDDTELAALAQLWEERNAKAFLDGYNSVARSVVASTVHIGRSQRRSRRLRRGQDGVRSRLRAESSPGLGPHSAGRPGPPARRWSRGRMGVARGRSAVMNLSPEAEAIVEVAHPNPHSYLGIHEVDRKPYLRVWRPEAAAIVALLPNDTRVPLEQRHPAGLFEGRLPAAADTYQLEVRFHSGETTVVDDAYRFWPTLGDVDLHLIGEGRHERLWEVMGAHTMVHQGVAGTAFAVWAPAATSVRVVGDFNFWNDRAHPMRALGASGVWELFIPGAGEWARYKYEVVTHDGRVTLKADPLAQFSERPPGSASIIVRSGYEWGDANWLDARASADVMHDRLSIYEVHLGSWKRVPEEGERPLSYVELADELSEYVRDLGFTHVELMPVMEHPYGGSWGYQVSGYFSPTSRFGTPDDLRYFVDRMHQAGIGVIVDWVPAHFPRDEWALARFDGTALYEHADPRLGEHPDWGTLVFNFGRHEVRNFLMANALYWIEEFHMDGLRVDAVASMLYLDYSREPGQWVPNIHGGRENLQAIAFLQEFNSVVHLRHPGVLTIAEESTDWGGVSSPVSMGGLGFTHKWNMGWMHDTLDYFSQNPVHRKWHHNELTFGLVYAWSENFVLPLSHDEVVHLKRSLLGKMPGDRWQQLANLRALLAWMWAHPGKQLMFMGGELAQEEEWAHDRSLDWHLLDLPAHRGVMELVREINRLQEAESALWADDFSAEGFRWIDADGQRSQRAVVPAHQRRGWAVGGLRGEPHAGAEARLPGRAARGRGLDRALEHGRQPVGRQRHRQPVDHHRRHRLAGVRPVRRPDPAAARRGVAGAGTAEAQGEEEVGGAGSRDEEGGGEEGHGEEGHGEEGHGEEGHAKKATAKTPATKKAAAKKPATRSRTTEPKDD